MAGSEECISIGIDLGTIYSYMAVWQHDHIEIIVNDQGHRTTPSQIAFTDIDSLVGEAASNQAMKNPLNSIFNSKRLIGRRRLLRPTLDLLLKMQLSLSLLRSMTHNARQPDAGITAGLNVMSILNEPTVAPLLMALKRMLVYLAIKM
ncbi:hypothetical protein M0R45_035271 [Rubus argutus]|uniref:Heat shock protein 70 n=1 Tax=Rubus argutus TaxID=59490 RepID=A0AAW1VU54_RUBAR